LKIILYTKDFNEKIKEKVDIILSPEFYWIKKIDFKIKNLKEAKKISKNLFKLPNEEYYFDAFKINDNFFVIAIKKNLDIKIEKKYINSIRLAQIELYDYECIKVRNCIMKKIDDILFCLPLKNLNEKCVSIEEILDKIKLSKHTFNIFNIINIDKEILFYIFASLLIFNVTFLMEAINYKYELNKIEKERQILSEKYNLPINNYQLNAILNDLEQEEKRIIKIKKILEYLSKLPIKNFKKINFDSKIFTIVIESNKKLDKYFKKFKIIDSKIINNKYIIKFKL